MLIQKGCDETGSIAARIDVLYTGVGVVTRDTLKLHDTLLHVNIGRTKGNCRYTIRTR